MAHTNERSVPIAGRNDVGRIPEDTRYFQESKTTLIQGQWQWHTYTDKAGLQLKQGKGGPTLIQGEQPLLFSGEVRPLSSKK